jgi:hypothetical protein
LLHPRRTWEVCQCACGVGGFGGDFLSSLALHLGTSAPRSIAAEAGILWWALGVFGSDRSSVRRSKTWSTSQSSTVLAKGSKRQRVSQIRPRPPFVCQLHPTSITFAFLVLLLEGRVDCAASCVHVSTRAHVRGRGRGRGCGRGRVRAVKRMHLRACACVRASYLCLFQLCLTT